MKNSWKRPAAFTLAAAMICAQGTLVSAEPGPAGSADISYLTLQPGETEASVNLNWYAPAGTERAMVKFSSAAEEITAEASVSALTAPTKLDTGKYTDTGLMVCKASVDGLEPETVYTYQVSYDGGASWLGGYPYTTAGTDGFRFGFTSDPQIKEDQSNDDQGWNPVDGTNQTGWASMMEKLAEEGYDAGKLNVDEEQELAARYRVMSIPTLIIFKDGKEVDRTSTRRSLRRKRWPRSHMRRQWETMTDTICSRIILTCPMRCLWQEWTRTACWNR